MLFFSRIHLLAASWEWEGICTFYRPARRCEYIRTYIQGTHHQVGTCKMGHDHLAVVDEQLRIHGIEGLRVADASIMPTIMNANPNAAVIMIAEKGANLIRK